MLLTQTLYLYLLALTLAFVEVQIEGPDGWAARLPCWRPTGKWYAKLYTKVMGGKELTGYHVGVFSFSFLILHFPYASGLPWSFGAELETLSMFFLFVVVWDFLWFVLNPHFDIRGLLPNAISPAIVLKRLRLCRNSSTDTTYMPRNFYFASLASDQFRHESASGNRPLKQFRPGCVTWHKIWVAGLPVDYWGGFALSFLFHALRVDAGEGIGYGTWLVTTATFVLLLSITIVTVHAFKYAWRK